VRKVLIEVVVICLGCLSHFHKDQLRQHVLCFVPTLQGVLDGALTIVMHPSAGSSRAPAPSQLRSIAAALLVYKEILDMIVLVTIWQAVL
jgi:hypothetical protein